MTEAVPSAFLGRALAVRSILGIGVGAVAPWAFGVVLDLGGAGALTGAASGWGWAFVLMGVGGLIATVCAALLPAVEIDNDLAHPERPEPPRP
jgi:MFS family permease